MTLATVKKTLAAAGLRVAFEPDATSGFEFLISDAAGETVAVGYHEGSKADAAQEALRHPVVKLKLAKGAL